jgi:hypothetical protein
MAEDKYITEDECKRRRESMTYGIQCMIKKLDEHDIQAKCIKKDTDDIKGYVADISKYTSKMSIAFEEGVRSIVTNLDRTTALQTEAAAILKVEAENASWFRNEISAMRKANAGVLHTQNVTIKLVLIRLIEIVGSALAIVAGLKITGVV